MTREEKLQLNRDRQKAVRDAWVREKSYVQQGKGTVDWTPEQQKELLETGRVKGYEGQHMKSCAQYPEYAASADNIQLLSHDNHLAAHNSGKSKSGYRSPTNGYYDCSTGKMISFGSKPPKAPKAIKLSASFDLVGSKTLLNQTNKQNGGTTMAQRVDEAKYGAMISALYSFASNVYTSASEMQSLASVCAQALSEEDKAVGEIYKKIKECQLKYAEATEQAKSIASSMQQELDEQKKEDEIWNSDD